MKRCPRCGQSYPDQDINFCLNDGELLSRLADAGPSAYDDSPPTVVLDQARVTNPIGWNTQAQPPMQYQPPQGQIFTPYMLPKSPDQTLAIVSIAAGAASLTIGWCCYSGLLLGPAAMITGFISLSQSKKDPQNYGGRGLAIGGIVAGALYLLILIVIMIIYALALMFG